MESAINLGANIARLRKERRLTQEEVAAHVGVTKASVSKWETGQSCPDVSLLPRIAALFDVSIDALMGYEPQLSSRDIRDACERLRGEFAEGPIEDAFESCKRLAGEYFACPALLAQVAAVVLNHSLVTQDVALAENMQAYVVELCQRVRRLEASVTDLRQANTLEGIVELMRGRPDRTAEILQGADAPDCGELILLANAYQAQGEMDQAKRVLQMGLFQMLVLSLNVLAQMASVSIGDVDRIRETYRRTLGIIDAFEMDDLYANAVAVHLSFAIAYAASGAPDEAIDCLERYLAIAKRMEFPIKLHGDEFFDGLDAYLEELDFSTSAPLGEPFQRARLLQGVAENPALAMLADDPRFQRIVKELEVVVR